VSPSLQFIAIQHTIHITNPNTANNKTFFGIFPTISFTMHFHASFISALAIISVASAAGVETLFYAKNFAPVQAARINNYRADHADTLTAEQLAVLDKSLDIIKTQDRSQTAALRSEAEAAFGVAEAAFLLSGRERETASENDAVVARRNIGRRARDCTCSTDDNYCSDSKWCKYNHNDCKFNGGCGTLWLEECDGMCVKK
jgi:hypothetical protein